MCEESGVAQGKRGGLITRRSVDRNHSPLTQSFYIFYNFYEFIFIKTKHKQHYKHNTQNYIKHTLIMLDIRFKLCF